MKAASISEIKRELSQLESTQLLEICLRLAKYKKDNKELLDYLLFDSDDEDVYIKKVKEEIDIQYQSINKSNLYWAKKSLRKILKITNKYIRYSTNKKTEIELLIYYCTKLRNSGIHFRSSTALNNLYNQQIKKISKALSSLHEDLQFDYQKELEELM